MFITRKFQELNYASDQEQSPPKTIDECYTIPAFVVLGDPGSGKTTSFQNAAAEEPDAVYVTVRDFLCLSVDRWKGKIIYLDGLDEQRAKTNDGTTVLDAIRNKLDELGCPSFRLSCRAADWFGLSDADPLSLVSPDGKICVLQLEPLTEEDIVSISKEYVSNPHDFVSEAKKRDIYDLLINPQTLNLILTVIGHGDWPTTKTELYENAYKILLEETNEEHELTQVASLTDEQLFNAAGFLCAIYLCSGVEGFSVNSNSDPSYINLDEIDFKHDHLRAVTKRRVFKSDGAEKFSPIHRTVAEYLAAKYVARCIREGLPLNRAISIITGNDGGTLSELRGLFGWIACLLPEYASDLYTRDPLGVVLYGDTAALPVSSKQEILNELGRLAQTNPWFRSENWAAAPFGGLSSPDMVDYFQEALLDKRNHSVFLSCVVDAISNGPKLSKIDKPLLNIIMDNAHGDFLRESALQAFCNLYPNDHVTLINILDDIDKGKLTDHEIRLRGEILQRLYPDVIKPSKIADYFVKNKSNFIGNYIYFIEYKLIDMTPIEGIPVLLDAVSNKIVSFSHDEHYSYKQFLSKLLYIGLVNYGEHVDTGRLYDWCGVLIDEYGGLILNRNKEEKIQSWFLERPKLVESLILHWISITDDTELSHKEYYFMQRLHIHNYPVELFEELLIKAKDEVNSHVADFLFRAAITICIRNMDVSKIEDLEKFISDNPKFKSLYDLEIACEIPSWRIENAIEKTQREIKAKDNKEKRIQDLSKKINDIKKGDALNDLIFLAKVYFGLFSDIDRELPVLKRIEELTNIEIARSASEGFVSFLSGSITKTPLEIGEAWADGKHYPLGYVVLAGMNEMAKSSSSFLSLLSKDVLKSAILYHYVNITEGEKSWVESLITDFAEPASEAFKEFFGKQLEKNDTEHVPGLYEFADNEAMSEVVSKIALTMLKKFPSCNERNLEYLLKASIRHSNRDELANISSDVLNRSGYVKGKKRLYWLVTAFILNPDEYIGKIKKYVGTNPERVNILLRAVFSSWTKGKNPEISISPKYKIQLFNMLARVYTPDDIEPKDRSTSGAYSVTSRMETARRTNELLNVLSNDLSNEVTETLIQIHMDKKYSAWKDRISNALAIQSRIRREEIFEYPDVKQVIETFKNGNPANSVDLQALVIDQLISIFNELRHGPTDGYKVFWNVDKHGRPDKPRPENDCRDRILDRLRIELFKKGVTAEPEGMYADDKRADIKVIYDILNIPVEIKRHYHGDVWTAPVEQLKELYSRDPGTEGRGVFLVLWFGADVKQTPPLPTGASKPKTANDMERILNNIIPKSDQDLIEIIVADCSNIKIRAAKKKATKKKATKKKQRKLGG